MTILSTQIVSASFMVPLYFHPFAVFRFFTPISTKLYQYSPYAGLFVLLLLLLLAATAVPAVSNECIYYDLLAKAKQHAECFQSFNAEFHG